MLKLAFRVIATWSMCACGLSGQELSVDHLDSIEEARLRELVRTMSEANPFIVAHLEASESQITLLKAMLQAIGSTEDSLERRQVKSRNELLAVIQLDEGGVEDARKALNKLDIELTDLRRSHNDQLLNEVLVPWQAFRLRQIARQQRVRAQVAKGHEFEIPLVIADEIGLPEKQKAKMREVIEAARKEYYAKLDKLRKKSEKNVLDSLPEAKRRMVLELLGDAYDYQAELDESAKRQQSLSVSGK